MIQEVLREREVVTTDATTYTFYSRYVWPGEQWKVRRVCATSDYTSACDLEVGITSGGEVVKIAHLENIDSSDYTCENLDVVLREGERLQYVYHGASGDIVGVHVAGTTER